MKFLSLKSENGNTKFLWKNAPDLETEISLAPESPMQKFAAETVSDASKEVNEDVNDVLENKIGASRIKRLWNKAKHFFKTRIFNVTENDYPQNNKEDTQDEYRAVKKFINRRN